MPETSSAADPVINVIEQDIPGGADMAVPSRDDSRPRRLDTATMDAVSARRRREFDAARARLRDQAIRDTGDIREEAEAPRPGSRPRADRPPENTNPTLAQPPERVRKRYLRAGHQYFLKDAPYQLAFEDLGPYLVTEHNRPDVVESMVDIAAARSWQRIRVSGHAAFRREVWLQATMLGIEVSGYAPEAADLARLADARQGRLNNRIEADASMPPAAVARRVEEDHARPSFASQDDRSGIANGTSQALPPGVPNETPVPVNQVRAASDEPDAPRRYAGELREHGRAPYQNNPARSASYYVVFRDATGADHIVWGVDLERAVQESGAEPGQPVTLENLGRRLVTVKAPILDANGVVVGEEDKDVYRNTWQVDRVERERSVIGAATHSRDVPDGGSPSVNVPADGAGRKRARSTISDEDKVLHLAVLASAMREQGFSARSISRVRQRAEAMLDVLGQDGVQVPRPRIFDPKAPSERERRVRTASGRTRTREVERAPAEPSLPTR